MPIGVYKRNNPKGHIQTEATKKKIGKASRGRFSPIKGKTFEEQYGFEKAKEIKKKISEYRKGKSSGMLGKHHSDITRLKQSKSLKGKISKIKNKTWEEILGFENAQKRKMQQSIALKGKLKGKTWEEKYGIEKAKELKKKQSEVSKGNTYHLGKLHSEKTKKLIGKKNRLAVAKRIEKNYGICWPNYNLKACEVFKSFDIQNDTKGQYAVYGGGEHFIKELGYWLDYINFDKKIIIEVDEKHHYDRNGNLRECDIKRQKEIQEHFPNFEFLRIKDNDLVKAI